MTGEGEPTGEIVHKGDQLLAMFNMAQFGQEPIDVGDGRGPIHQARDYPYVTPHARAQAMIDGMLALPENDPRRPMVIQAGAREMAKRLNLVQDPKNKGGWVRADGRTPTGTR